MLTAKRLKRGVFLVVISTLVLVWGTSCTRKSEKVSTIQKEIYWEAPYEVKIAERKKENNFILFALRIIRTHNPSLNNQQAKEIARTIYEVSAKYGYDPYFILSIIKVESSFNPAAVSPVGAIGLMQIMPQVGEYLADIKGINLKNYRDLFDIKTNIELGVFYFKFLHQKYRNIKMALLAYNMGPGNLNYFLKNKRWPANDYHEMVLKFYSRIKYAKR